MERRARRRRWPTNRSDEVAVAQPLFVTLQTLWLNHLDPAGGAPSDKAPHNDEEQRHEQQSENGRGDHAAEDTGSDRVLTA